MYAIVSPLIAIYITRHRAYYFNKLEVIHKTGSTQLIATLSEDDRVTVIVNIHRKLGEVCRVVFEICKQTDRQTRSLQ